LPVEKLLQQTETVALPEPVSLPEVKFQAPVSKVVEQDSRTVVVPSEGISDKARATLEGWLENIGRIKSCR
jgi:hypothetical protein